MTSPSPVPISFAEDSWVPVRHGGKPRILYMITRAERGGAQMHVLDLACAMRGEFDVAVATGEDGFLVEECRDNGIPVYIVPHLQRKIWPPADACALLEINQLIKQLQPDLIHAHTFKAGILGRFSSRLLGVPSIYTMHTWLFGTPALPRLWGMLGAPCERLAARWCSRLIAVSDAGVRIASQHRVASQSKVVTIRNGIPDCSERANLKSDHVPVITMVARFTEAKEHELLLRAFASIAPGPRLRLIGGGPLLDTCKNLAKELGVQDRVDFLGNRQDIPSLLAASDVFVLATKFEMFSLSILEAMRAGLPVIASDVGGNREAIVDGETGYLVPGGSAAALADALRQVIDNPELRQRLGRAARLRFTQQFLFAHQERLTRNVYHEVLLESRRVAHRQESTLTLELAGNSQQGEAA
jgi:glycosyltransferase involved in cell wall biosynthesis